MTLKHDDTEKINLNYLNLALYLKDNNKVNIAS